MSSDLRELVPSDQVSFKDSLKCQQQTISMPFPLLTDSHWLVKSYGLNNNIEKTNPFKDKKYYVKSKNSQISKETSHILKLVKRKKQKEIH